MRRFTLILLLALLFLTACKPQVTHTPVSEETQTGAAPTDPPTATPTVEPPITLTVCTTSLPASLFPYDGFTSAAKENLLAMTQGDLFEKSSGSPKISILAEMPSQENGGIALTPVSVQRGQTVVDARGELVTLKAGVSIRPSGCQETACAVTWNGETDLTMDQMSVSFQLNDGLTWSDGAPVTAADSVFSFSLANDPAAPGMQWFESRTFSYTAYDDQSLIWIGKPGFTTSQIEQLFWAPLPSHLFENSAGWADVSGDVRWSGAFPGFGPFSVVEWDETTIMLERNPYSVLTDETSFSSDIIMMEVIPNPNDALAALENGTCDVLDQSYHFENDADALGAIQANPSLNLFVGQSDSWEQLVFGIQPASYDDYYNPVYGDRPDIFGDVRTRQAFAACLDRAAIQQSVHSGLADLWPSFVPARESQLPQDQNLNHDPAQGIQLLEEVGWRDHDSDPSTAMLAWYVNNVPSGTILSVDLYVDQSPVRQVIAAGIQQSLGDCGIEVNTISQPAELVYTPGPDGPLFGRQFDLALLAWAPLPELDCGLYESWQAPSPGNNWIGTNIAGFSDSAFDAACSDAALALPSKHQEARANAESQFISSLFSVPLLSNPVVIVTTNEFCSEVVSLMGIDFLQDGSDPVCP